ncbi:MAG: hypothetical protein HYT11_02015 [Candidatus Levybacteria bacterium]|nr:hypothetical protein [Candidatus Levybacteria bacterium]
MLELENPKPQQLDSSKAARDPLVDAFFNLESPEQIIHFYLSEATLFRAESGNIYTPKQSLTIVFDKYLGPLCFLTFFYPEKILVWKKALGAINDACATHA